MIHPKLLTHLTITRQLWGKAGKNNLPMDLTLTLN